MSQPDLFRLPRKPDRVTSIRRSLFNDGPGNPVWITRVSLDDAAAGMTRSVSFSAGRSVDVLTETVALQAYIAPDRWTLVYRATAVDGDGRAEIRVTESRVGDTLTAVKEVRPVGGGDADWALRNQTRLTRTCD